MLLDHEDYPHLAALCFMLIACLNEALTHACTNENMTYTFWFIACIGRLSLLFIPNGRAVRTHPLHSMGTRLELHAEPINTCNEEWRIRKAKRTVTMAAYEDRWPFGCALASLLLSHGDGVDLTRHAKTRKRKARQPSNDTVVLWPVAENRNVSKRMWESQAMAARHCLDGNTMLYFRFWLLCTQPGNYIVG